MITIIVDRHAYTSPQADALTASKIADYVLVRRRIRAALDQDEPLTVYATDPVLLNWLADLQRYPESRVTWRIVDPGEEFTKLFGVAPTAPFTSACIAALKLHNLPRLPAGIFVHPLTWILGHRLGSVWQHDDPPPRHLALLAEWALNRKTPLEAELIALVQAQLERWSVNQPIYRTLRATRLTDDSANLLIRWALQHYEGVWRNTQPWGNLPLLDGEPSPTALLTALHGQQEKLQAYWSRQIVDSTIDATFIYTTLKQMSGLSKAELDAFTVILDRLPDALDTRLLQAIQDRFKHLPNTQQTLRYLAKKIAPPIPPLPDFMWPVDRWLTWATQQYMPYYAWVIQNEHGRDHQQACALQYSDWLYSQYPSWLNDERSPLLLRQYQDMYNLIEDDKHIVVIWLVIDGMTWWQGCLMRDICERHGLHLQSQIPGIAALPSITSVSKRVLVTGQPTIDLAQPTIAEAARVKLARSDIPSIVGYSLQSAIETLQQNDTLRVAVVLFNLIDALSHQTATFTDDAGIRGYLDDLAAQLSKAQQICAKQGRRLHVFIGSDHGSTLLPQDAPSLPLPIRTQEIDDIWESELPEQEAQKPGTRAAATDLDTIPSINQQVWYALDRDRFQLDRHYLVPRGYGYIKRRPSAWTHGGLTPEETIVPLLHVASERPRMLPLEIEFRGALRAGQAGTIIAVLRNLNPFPVQELTLMVSGTTEEATIKHIAAHDQQEIELYFATVQVHSVGLPIVYEVRYDAFGNLYRDAGQDNISIRRLQTDDTSFDDMFS